MISQGTGGGVGDPLERKPEDVIRDRDEDLITHDVAWRVYRVVYDNETLHVDEQATEEAREIMRRERIAKSKPFDAFCKEWVKDKPNGKVPYYGSWDDRSMVHTGSPDTLQPAAQINPPVVMAHPLQVKIDRLEAELAACRKQQG